MYGCESWTTKKAECRRADAFDLWCWRRLLTVSWTTRRLNQSILKEINPEYSLEGLMLKLQYFGRLMPGSFRKDPDAGKDWWQKEKRVTEDEMVGWHRLLNGHEFEQTQGDSEVQGSLTCLCPWGCKESDMSEHQNNTFLLCLEWHHLSSNLLVLFYFPFPI